MRTIAVCNRKGGVGKTTLAVGLAACLPDRVGLIDLDDNGSALHWMEDLDLFDVAAGSASTIVQAVPSLADSYDWLVLDTPPNDAEAITAAAAVSDLVLIPMAPSPLEADQLPDTLALLPASQLYLVVPSRVRRSTSAGKTIQQLCADAGHPVSATVLPLSERVVQSFAMTPVLVMFRPLADEIVARWKETDEQT
jgi:chromosome partitioning protein